MSENGRVSIKLAISEFELPPIQDALIIGRAAPIGAEAAKRMMDAIAPEEFAVLPVDDELAEAIVIRQSLLRTVPPDLLIGTLLEHARGLIRHRPLLKVRVDVSFATEKSVIAWQQE